MIHQTWSSGIGRVGHFSPHLLFQFRQLRIAQLPLPSELAYFPLGGQQLTIPFPKF